MRVSPIVIVVAGASLFDCVDPAKSPGVDERPPPILHFADHSDIPPDELGALGAPTSSATASPMVDAGASSATPMERRPIEPCVALASPPPAPVATHRVQSGPPVTNYIPPSIIMRPVRARAACFRACYDRALAKVPDVRGRVVVHFIVDEDGFVRTANVGAGTDLPDVDAAKCVAAQFVGLVYPRPEGGRVEVHYPIAFEP